jgi:hypothetical protein
MLGEVRRMSKNGQKAEVTEQQEWQQVAARALADCIGCKAFGRSMS